MYDELEIYSDEITPKPRRSQRLKKFLIGFVALALVGAAVFVLLNLFKTSVNPFSFGLLRGELDGRVNIMLLGVGDPGHAGETLTDTNILMSVNTRTKQVSTVSIPRDLRVALPKGGYGKINQAHSKGGIPGAEEVFEETLGVPVHYYVRANFTGLRQAVDAVGGIDIEVKESLYDPEYPCDKNQYRSCGFRLAKGQQHMNGTTALKYVRCRKGNCGDDFGRAQRQQEVMQAIRAKATGLDTITNPYRLGKLIAATGSNIKTNLSVNNILRLNDLTKDTAQDQMIGVVLSLQPDGFLVSSKTSSDLVPRGNDFDDIHSFVQKIFSLGPVWTEHPTLQIENGTTTMGTAGQVKSKIERDGYTINVTGLANALKRDYTATQIIDYTGGKKKHTIAYLEKLLGVKAVPPPTPVKVPLADFRVIVGTDFVQANTKPSAQ
ncbi:MAG TPA: LCP family protein [Candidatus Dormibacteraeota bacterium]|nr:LCP family protein [Candidatus Dormibacteraeota bacterium]